jgi:hypothetical protein
MISSISSSKPTPSGAGAEASLASRAWLKTFCITLVAACGSPFLFLIVIDPFDSGRFPSLPIRGVIDAQPRRAAVSRGRDPQFDAAVFGSSTGQLMEPSTLSRATGLRFVQLTIPGGGPDEQLVVLRWFLRHHREIGALALVADASWCIPDPRLPEPKPFPTWLYSDSDLEYLSHLFNGLSFEFAARRVRLALGMAQPTAADGYANYDVGGLALQPPASLPDKETATAIAPADLPFPAIDRLGDLLDAFAPTAPLAIVMPPVFVTVLPRQGSAEANVLASCKARFARFARLRPRGSFLDFRVDDDPARDPGNFRDKVHMRTRLAQMVEERIVAALNAAVSPTRPPREGLDEERMRGN